MARETVQYIIPTDLDDIPDGTTYQKIAITEATRLGSCDETATPDQSEADIKTLFTWTTSPEDGATADQTGLEVQSAITGLADGDRVLVGSEPATGEKKVYGVHINAAGNIETDQDTVAES